jgi:hypothetical protein
MAHATGEYALNSGDVGLLRSLDGLSSEDASRSVNSRATIAAHAARPLRAVVDESMGE